MFIRINRLWLISVKFRLATNRLFPKSKILFWFSFVVKINAFRSSDIFRKLFTEKSFNGIRGAASELKIGFKWIICTRMVFKNCFRWKIPFLTRICISIYRSFSDGNELTLFWIKTLLSDNLTINYGP